MWTTSYTYKWKERDDAGQVLRLVQRVTTFRPSRAFLKRIATALDIETVELLRADREAALMGPPRQASPTIQAVLRRGGPKGLARRMLRNFEPLDPLTSEDRSKHAREVMVPRRLEWLATRTPAERARFGWAKLHVRLAGRLGICQVCETMTYNLDGQPTTYHPECLRGWRANSDKWQLWAFGARNRGAVPPIARPNSGPEPQPPQFAEQLSDRELADLSLELANLHALTVLYVRVQLALIKGGSVMSPTKWERALATFGADWQAWLQRVYQLGREGAGPEPQPPAGSEDTTYNTVPRTIGELAVRLIPPAKGPSNTPKARRVATLRLLKRVKHFIELLPDPAVCGFHFGESIRMLADGLIAIGRSDDRLAQIIGTPQK